MYNFNFYMPTKVLFGPGKLSELHSEQLPGKKALIAIGGQSVKKYGYLETLEKELDTAGIEHVLFEGIRPNPTDIMSWMVQRLSVKMAVTLSLLWVAVLSWTVQNVSH